jgi:His/Glu/Gln/Arg/opine family amino acid ABC transporter permease subunit
MYLITLFEDMGKIFVKYWDLFLIKGLSATILLSLMTVVFGTVLGAVFALIKIGKIKALKWIVNAVVEVIRGTPMLLQLYISTFLIPVVIPAMNQLENKKLICISLTLILNSGAYVSEIIRSGIEAVDKGQTEAARSLGLNSTVTMTEIVLPQAVKNILPAIGSEFVSIIKETSMASTFFIGDLMTSYLKVKGATYLALEALIIVAVIYFILTFFLSKVILAYERRLNSK